MHEEARVVTVAETWFGAWRGPSALRLSPAGIEVLDPFADAHLVGPGTPHLPGVVLAPFTDSHVHLGLIDPSRLPGGGIARVVDLGWEPATASSWLADAPAVWPRVRIVGGLLCAPRGYPSASGWAPPEAAIAVRDAPSAVAAVDRMREAGATMVKITLNSDVGPVFSDAVLAAVVDAAHDLLLPVAAHVQGVGQAGRALDAGVDVLAHTPFSERLPDDDVARFALSTSWLSTLDIHGYGAGGRAHRIAIDNLSRFAAAGGRVVYGTDLGNGDLPLGVDERELRALRRAGLDRDALLTALAPDAELEAAEPGPHLLERVTWIADDLPTDDDDAPAWLATATALTPDQLWEKTL
ncbi:amidohydrolase [Frigoribacterium sp. 2-23]|uniref:amidohydrolase n=1 Tax=Frigoribacterium sp. 2-23 TaxID=3415006 RepID=UPI003C6FA82C